MTEARFCRPRPTLTAKEREIAIAAIGARVSGSPADAAAQLLSGIAVLDGNHLPILVWPNGLSMEEAADWHERNGKECRLRAQRFSERMAGVNSNARTVPAEHSDPTQKPNESARPPQYPVSSAPNHLEAGTGNHLPEDRQLHSEASVAASDLEINLKFQPGPDDQFYAAGFSVRVD